MHQRMDKRRGEPNQWTLFMLRLQETQSDSDLDHFVFLVCKLPFSCFVVLHTTVDASFEFETPSCISCISASVSLSSSSLQDFFFAGLSYILSLRYILFASI